MKFSKATGCFYPEHIAYNDLPADSIDVPQEDFDAAMARQAGDILDAADGRVIVVPKPMPASAEIKAAKWAAIKAERDRRIERGGYNAKVKGANHWFHSDQKSRSQQIALMLLGEDMPKKLRWKTLDGTFVAMTPRLARRLVAAAAASDQAVFAAAEAHKAALEAGADPAAYDFSGGWPPVYGQAPASAGRRRSR